MASYFASCVDLGRSNHESESSHIRGRGRIDVLYMHEVTVNQDLEALEGGGIGDPAGQLIGREDVDGPNPSKHEMITGDEFVGHAPSLTRDQRSLQ